MVLSNSYYDTYTTEYTTTQKLVYHLTSHLLEIVVFTNTTDLPQTGLKGDRAVFLMGECSLFLKVKDGNATDCKEFTVLGNDSVVVTRSFSFSKNQCVLGDDLLLSFR